jgi:hypothetical protein
MDRELLEESERECRFRVKASAREQPSTNQLGELIRSVQAFAEAEPGRMNAIRVYNIEMDG